MCSLYHDDNTSNIPSTIVWRLSHSVQAFELWWRLPFNTGFSRFLFVTSLPELQLHRFYSFLTQNSFLRSQGGLSKSQFRWREILPTSWRRRSLAYEIGSPLDAMTTTRTTLPLETTSWIWRTDDDDRPWIACCINCGMPLVILTVTLRQIS